MKKGIFIVPALFVLASLTSGCIDMPWDRETGIDIKVTAHVIDDEPSLYEMEGNFTAIAGIPETVTLYSFHAIEGSNVTGTFEQIGLITLTYDNDTVTIPEAKQYKGTYTFTWDGKGALCAGYRNADINYMDGITVSVVNFSSLLNPVPVPMPGTVTVHHWEQI